MARFRGVFRSSYENSRAVGGGEWWAAGYHRLTVGEVDDLGVPFLERCWVPLRDIEWCGVGGCEQQCEGGVDLHCGFSDGAVLW